MRFALRRTSRVAKEKAGVRVLREIVANDLPKFEVRFSHNYEIPNTGLFSQATQPHARQSVHTVTACPRNSLTDSCLVPHSKKICVLMLALLASSMGCNHTNAVLA